MSSRDAEGTGKVAAVISDAAKQRFANKSTTRSYVEPKRVNATAEHYVTQYSTIIVYASAALACLLFCAWLSPAHSQPSDGALETSSWSWRLRGCDELVE